MNSKITFKKKYCDRWEISRKKKKKYTHIYDIIPSELLKEPVLEIGPGEGIRQVNCRHKEFFLNADYLGIDLLVPEKPELNIIQGSIIDFTQDRNFKFNTVLAIGSMEHICLDQWTFLCRKLKTMCKKDGNVIVFVPYKESINKFFNGVEDHVVFGITKKFMNYFFPSAKIKIIYDQFKRYDESIFWALARWLKRLITFDKQIFKIIPRRMGLLVIWNKKK